MPPNFNSLLAPPFFLGSPACLCARFRGGAHVPVVYLLTGSVVQYRPTEIYYILPNSHGMHVFWCCGFYQCMVSSRIANYLTTTFELGCFAKSSKLSFRDYQLKKCWRRTNPASDAPATMLHDYSYGLGYLSRRQPEQTCAQYTAGKRHGVPCGSQHEAGPHASVAKIK
jgi:hypothetical protein